MPRPPKGIFRKGKSYYTRIRSGGHDDWINLGRNLEEASRKFRRIKQGEIPVAKLSLRDAVETWLTTYIETARKRQNQQIARQRAEMYLIKFLGYNRLGNVSPDHLRRYRLWLEKRTLSVQTVAHILSDCRCFFNWCEDSGFINRTPFPRRLMPRVQEKAPNRLTDDEVGLIVSLPDPWGITARFGLSTGLRWGEMCRARTSDIQNGTLVVSQTKSGKVRRVPLPQDFLAELSNRVGRIVPYSVRSSGSFARDVRSKTGIERFHAHQLRHTFACRWLERGGTLAVLQQILGHASVITTQRYARLTDEMVRQEAARIQLTGKTVEKTVEVLDSEVVTHCALVAQVDRATVS